MEGEVFINHDELLESTCSEALLQNEINESRWKMFKEDHQALRSRLVLLRDRLKHDIMVPIGKLALMKGKLVHTNEILVSLGDGWFARKSSAEASKFCERKIKDCNDMLDKLIKERDLLISRKNLRLEHDLVFNDELIEPFDEAAEAEWKVKHHERVKAYKHEEAKKRQGNKIKDEKDVFELLDTLELQEEEEDEFNRLSLNEEDDGYSDEKKEDTDNGEDCDSHEGVYVGHSSKELLKDVNDIINSDENELCITSLYERRKHLKNSQKVSFAEETNNGGGSDTDQTDPFIIHFKHSEFLPKSNDCKDEYESRQKIVSPGDIFRAVTVPLSKSILKNSISVPCNIDEECCEGIRDMGNVNLDNIRKKRSEVNPQVEIGAVTEHSQVLSPVISSARKISKFKAARQATKNF